MNVCAMHVYVCMCERTTNMPELTSFALKAHPTLPLPAIRYYSAGSCLGDLYNIISPNIDQKI